MSGRRSSAVVAISDSGVGSRQSALRLVAICRCAGSTRRPTRASDRPLRSGWSSACWYDQHSLRSRQPPCSGASDLGPHTHTARCARSIACQIDYCRLGCFVCCARYKRCCFFFVLSQWQSTCAIVHANIRDQWRLALHVQCCHHHPTAETYNAVHMLFLPFPAITLSSIILRFTRKLTFLLTVTSEYKLCVLLFRVIWSEKDDPPISLKGLRALMGKVYRPGVVLVLCTPLNTKKIIMYNSFLIGIYIESGSKVNSYCSISKFYQIS